MVPEKRGEREENPRRGSPKFGGSGKFDDRTLESLPLTREYGPAYSRQSDFGLTHYVRRVNFNDSDMLESADCSISRFLFKRFCRIRTRYCTSKSANKEFFKRDNILFLMVLF